MTRKLEIICSACGADTILKYEPVYEGFVKKGDKLLCLSCGHVYESGDVVPFKQKKKNSVFDESDRISAPEIFKSDEKGRNCRYCKYYIVNPFTQRCGLHTREVAATDICSNFEA